MHQCKSTSKGRESREFCSLAHLLIRSLVCVVGESCLENATEAEKEREREKKDGATFSDYCSSSNASFPTQQRWRPNSAASTCGCCSQIERLHDAHTSRTRRWMLVIAARLAVVALNKFNIFFLLKHFRAQVARQLQLCSFTSVIHQASKQQRSRADAHEKHVNWLVARSFLLLPLPMDESRQKHQLRVSEQANLVTQFCFHLQSLAFAPFEKTSS